MAKKSSLETHTVISYVLIIIGIVYLVTGIYGFFIGDALVGAIMEGMGFIGVLTGYNFLIK